jgi:hypothetical protein
VQRPIPDEAPVMTTTGAPVFAGSFATRVERFAGLGAFSIQVSLTNLIVFDIP